LSTTFLTHYQITYLIWGRQAERENNTENQEASDTLYLDKFAKHLAP
jgi:hypothetical protein